MTVYCGWSSEDFQSDVHVYEDTMGGYTTHVASRRIVFTDPLPEPVEWDANNVEPWFQRHFIVMDRVREAKREKIGGPNDGKTFRDSTPGACADRLEKLRTQGYRVPQYAIDLLREYARNREVGVVE